MMPYGGEFMGMPPTFATTAQYEQHCETIDVERMDEDDDDVCVGKSQKRANSSNSSSRPSSAINGRNPTCALCKNHGVGSPLKGHKRYCPFSRCNCDLCRVTRRKQKINASQVASRRAVQQDKELGIEQPTPSSSISGSSTPRTCTSPPRRAAEPTAVLIPSPSYVTNGGPVLFGENMSLRCFQLGRNASLLMNVLQSSRLSVEQLTFVDHDVCTAIRILKEEVSTYLKDIHRYLMDRIQREQLNRVNYVPNQFAHGQEMLNKELPHHSHLFRETVICPPPRAELYNPSGSSSQ